MSLPTIFSYLPEEAAAALYKHASDAAQPPPQRPSVLKPILAGVLGTGVGTLAGAGAAHLGNAAVKHFTGKNIPIPYLAAAAPIIGGAAGLAYHMAQAKQIEEMRRGSEAPDNNAKPQ